MYGFYFQGNSRVGLMPFTENVSVLFHCVSYNIRGRGVDLQYKPQSLTCSSILQQHIKAT